MAERKIVDTDYMLYYTNKIKAELDKKVNAETGKGLSSNDFTDAYKSSIDSVTSDLDNKVDKVTGKGLSTNDFTDAYKTAVDNKVDKVVGKGLSTNDYTTEEKTKLSNLVEGAEANVIESIQINGVAISPTNKTVNLDLTAYATKNDISSVYKYKGSVNNYAALPTSGQEVGDTYNVVAADSAHGIKAGDNVSWNGSDWDVLAGTVDLSGYLLKTELVYATNADVDSLFS